MQGGVHWAGEAARPPFVPFQHAEYPGGVYLGDNSESLKALQMAASGRISQAVCVAQAMVSEIVICCIACLLRMPCALGSFLAHCGQLCIMFEGACHGHPDLTSTVGFHVRLQLFLKSALQATVALVSFCKRCSAQALGHAVFRHSRLACAELLLMSAPQRGLHKWMNRRAAPVGVI